MTAGIEAYRAETKRWAGLVLFGASKGQFVSMTSFQFLLELGLCDLWPLLPSDWILLPTWAAAVHPRDLG